jgi:hypothetical protein
LILAFFLLFSSFLTKFRGKKPESEEII